LKFTLAQALLTLCMLAAPNSTCTEWPPELLPYEPYIVDAAEFHNLRPSLLAALIWRESGGDPDIVSRQGALGLTQVMPGIHACATLYPLGNIYCGASILARYTRNAGGDLRAGLAAYYAGESGREGKRGGWDFADLILSIEEWFEPGDGVAWCAEGGWTAVIVPQGRAQPQADGASPHAQRPPSTRRPRKPIPALTFLSAHASQ
jgi:hypothetical protein